MRTLLIDALNSVIAQAREDQSIQSVYGYSPYGQTTALADDEGNSLEYTGRENDSTTLYFYCARYYDTVLKRFVSEDPIGVAGGLNVYTYVEANSLNSTDPTGLETYQCKRPLGEEPGDNQRNGPDVPGNPFYHQYSCTRDANGKLVCGGQGMSGPWWGSPGKPTAPKDDFYDPQTCKKTRDDDKCFEKCLIDEWAKPRPRYGIPFGTDCQEYDDDVNRRCRKKCGSK